MKSTDHNINNPTSIDQIDLLRTANAMKFMKMEAIHRDAYDLLNPKDPHILYSVIEKDDQVSWYLGDNIVLDIRIPKAKYFLAPSIEPEEYGQYIIYINTPEKNIDFLVEITRFKDINEAIKALHAYNNAGSHSTIDLSLYNIIVSYINRDISIHEFIIGLISECGFRYDPRLQNVIQICISYGAWHLSPNDDIPVLFREELHNLRNSGQPLIKEYSDLYDMIVKYNFFKDKEFHPKNLDELNLSDIISEIKRIILSWLF